MNVANKPAILIVLALMVCTATTAHTESEGEMIPVGKPFVDFDLPAHDGSIVRSEDLAGRPFLLFFYPKADTPGWTLEANQLRDSWTDLQDLGIEVIGVSYDTPEKNRKFVEKNALPFRLLSDRDHELAKSVGAARTLIPFAKRISYLVGADGNVLVAYPEVDPATHAHEVLEDYRRLTASPP